jgi:UDP-N-acetylglucosamine diphosphorylase / glucose-1-phosphate thymidylyltransferase / UDP-N-acetylgalactosamine diphosphorylase / glucosamine-1-phosphate N-acetyltransferase / galactosamine-1-phosphate N-acetyltransferase
MKCVIFDDSRYNNFFPITCTRSTGDLRVGILKLRQRLAASLDCDDNYSMIIPEFLAKVYQERFSDRSINKLEDCEYLFVNSRLKIDTYWAAKIQKLPPNTGYFQGDIALAFRLKATTGDVSAETLPNLYRTITRIEIETNSCWDYIWELITANAEYICRDFSDFFYDKDNFFETEQGVTILDPYNVWLGEGSELKPGVVIDASEGPVVIDENCRIMPNAVIVGPVYIGKKSLIKAGARIYEGTSVGPVCKIGGEVENSIFQAYSNKQHDGFLGHSYLGEWINLGADTNNSDLKNNYQQVQMFSYPENKKINTGCQFLGSVIADHSKTAINSTINTGTVIGVGCNLFGHQLIKDRIPSFSWGNTDSLVPHKLDAFFETATVVKKRRHLPLSKIEQSMYKMLFAER